MPDLPECGDPGTISDIAVKDTQRIVGTIAKSLAYNSPYMNVIQGGTFPAGVSDEVRSVVQMPAAPGDSLAEPTFYCDTEMCGSVGHQDQTDSISYILRLESSRGRGPKVCVKKGYSAFKGAYIQAENSLKTLITQYINADIRAQLYRRSASKFVANSTYDFDSLFTGGLETTLGVKFAPILPDAAMSFKALHYVGRYLREVLLADWFETGGGMPHFRFIGGSDQVEFFRNEAGVLANMIALTTGGYKLGETTLTAYSFEQSPAYKGFAFGVDQRPLRATGFDEDGVPVLVNPVLIIANAAKNTAYARPNPAWLSAPYEIGTLLADYAFERLVPERYAGEGTFKFSPQLHMGELDWHYQIDNACNQWGDFGWHKYQITRAYKPIRPQHVVHFLYARPSADLGLTALVDPTSSSYTGSDEVLDLLPTCIVPGSES